MPTRLYRPFFLIILCATVFGCANSASHRVLKTEYASDGDLTCAELKRERRKAESVIRGVEQDQEDMTGADVVDGLLWFPFNVIAKQSNYSSATQAAEARIENLTLLETERGCRPGRGMTADRDRDEDTKIANQLRQLSALYKSGVLTKQEYISKKTAILNSIGGSIPTSTQPTPTTLQKQSHTDVGGHFYQAEQAAKQQGCSDVLLMASRYGKDIYTMQCTDMKVVLSCEFRKCSILN